MGARTNWDNHCLSRWYQQTWIAQRATVVCLARKDEEIRVGSNNNDESKNYGTSAYQGGLIATTKGANFKGQTRSPVIACGRKKKTSDTPLVLVIFIGVLLLDEAWYIERVTVCGLREDPLYAVRLIDDTTKPNTCLRENMTSTTPLQRYNFHITLTYYRTVSC